MRTAAVLAALLVSPAVAQRPGPSYSPPGGGYKVVFPGKPKEASQTAKTKVGDLKVLTATYATAEGNVFLASQTEFPADALAPDGLGTVYDGVRDGLKGKDGKVVSEKEVTVGDGRLPGREVLVDKGKQQTRFRVAVKGNRLYQVAAVGAGPFVTGAEATAFLDSFEPGK